MNKSLSDVVTNSSTKISKTRSLSVLIGIITFICLSLILPYHLSQFGINNSTELSTSLFVDKSANAQIEDIVNLPVKEWQTVDELNFGVSNSPHWLRVDLAKKQHEFGNILLINYALLDNVDVWFLKKNETEAKIVGAYSTGDTYPNFGRIINLEKFLFALPKNDQGLQVFIKAKSKGSIKIPIEIWSSKDLTQYSSLQKLFVGLFLGFIVAMAISHLFVYLTTGNKSFFIYTAYLTSIALTVSSLQGFGFQYLWPNSIWFQQFLSVLFATLSLVFVISLTIDLLSLNKKSVSSLTWLKTIRFSCFAIVALVFVLPYEVILKIIILLIMITTPLVFKSGIALAYKGYMVARYCCVAWAVLLISVILVSMDNLAIIESAIDPSYLLMVGAVTQALLLFMALSIQFSGQVDRANNVQNNERLSKLEAIKAKDDLIALQEKNQGSLEYNIEERNLELEIALRELAEKNSELEKLSAIDPLTGLMNRRFFDKRMLAESRRSRREKTQLGLAMLDIDHFKKINDSYGHLCGDYCLQVFANLLKETIQRPSDTICRYGGEEFVLILPNTGKAGLAKLLEKVRQNVENKQITFEGNKISMTVSIGACSRVIATEDEQELIITLADKLLYKAKETGRNRVIVE